MGFVFQRIVFVPVLFTFLEFLFGVIFSVFRIFGVFGAFRIFRPVILAVILVLGDALVHLLQVWN